MFCILPGSRIIPALKGGETTLGKTARPGKARYPQRIVTESFLDCFWHSIDDYFKT